MENKKASHDGLKKVESGAEHRVWRCDVGWALIKTYGDGKEMARKTKTEKKMKRGEGKEKKRKKRRREEKRFKTRGKETRRGEKRKTRNQTN